MNTYGAWHRSPQTYQERKLNDADEYDLVRAKRHTSNLPTDYDDMRIAALHEKSWKRRTKKQKKYRVNTNQRSSTSKHWKWRSFEYSRLDGTSFKTYALRDQLAKLGCHSYVTYKRTQYSMRSHCVLHWFGPNIVKH